MLYWLRKIFGRTIPAGNSAGAGIEGERAAAAWLVRERGFKVIAVNWRNPRDRRDEIDLVGRDGEVLVFVEVKTRAVGARVPGFYAVDARKKRVLRRTIQAYLAHLRENPRTFRFDVVEVVTGASPPAASPTATEAEHRAGEAAGAPQTATLAPGDPEILHFENIPLFPKHFRA